MADSMDKKYSNVPNLRFSFVSQYKLEKIGNLVIQKGKRAKNNELLLTPYSITNNDGFISQKEQWEGASYTKTSKEGYKVVEFEDIAYNPARINVGSVGLFTSSKGIVSSLYVCFHTNEKINPVYLFSYMKSEKFLKHIHETQEGGVRSYFFFDKLIKSQMWIPEIDEQEKIVNFLSLINERIDTQNKIIREIESSLSAIFKCFDKGDKKYYKLKNIGKYVSSDVLSLSDLNKGNIPTIIYGQLFTDYHYAIDKIISVSEKSNVLSSGNDVLFPASTTVDALSLISPSSLKIKNVELGGDMFSIQLLDDFDADYISFLLNFKYKNKLSKFAQGSTIIHLHFNDIANVEIDVPDLKEQIKTSKPISLLLKKLKIENEILKKYLLQKDYLIKNLFI